MINDLKQRAYEQERSENFGRAIELYESVIDHREAEGLTHQDASVFLRIADLHLRRDQEEDAIGAFQRAGELYAREGLQPQAIAVYRRVLRIAPGHTEALWNLAWLHAEMGVMAEAREYVADYLGTVDMERDWVEAKDFLRRLLDLTEDVAIGLRLAELLEEAGRHDQALEVLEQLDVEFAASSSLDEDEIRSRIEAIREEVVPEEERVGDEAVFESAAPPELDETSPGLGEPEEDPGFADEPAPGELAAEDRQGFGTEESGAGEEFDLEVDGGETGSLDQGFPFPDADEELENGALDEAESGDVDGEFGDGSDYDRYEPESALTEEETGDEELAGGEPDEDPWPDASGSGRGTWDTDEAEPSDEDRYEQFEEDEEEQMSTHSQDLPGGAAVGDDQGAGNAGASGHDDGGFGDPAAGTGVGRGAGTADRDTDYEEEYGERAELRRGLDVLDELIELDPDRLDHYRRRVGYAQRLDDREELVDSWLEMADTLQRRDSSRGARLVYEHVLGVDPGAERVREAIEELDRRAREALDVPELFPEADVPSGPAAGDSELAGWVWPELDRVRGRVRWLQGAAEMLRSAGHGGSADGPPARAYELMGRYFLADDDVESAIEVLSLALDRPDLGDDELADVLFQLGLSHYRIDDRGSARRYFDRVASHDEDFGSVCDWVLAES